MSFVEGELSRLRPVEREDYVTRMPTWVADREVTRFLVRGTFPLTREDWAEAYDAARSASSDVEFAIERSDDGRTVGVVGLHGTQWVARSAEFRILIGDRASWAGGVGTEVTQLVVAYGFEVLNLNRVWLGVNTDNHRALTSYRNVGFRDEGVLRQEVYRNGRYYDVCRLAILRDEYESVVATWKTFDRIVGNLRGSGSSDAEPSAASSTRARRGRSR
jgi:RimJ/RimL family protein N-acetyltransferase